MSRHLQCSNSTAIRLPRQAFADRTLRNISPGSCRSLGLDVGGPDHLAPFLGFRGDEAAKVGRRARNHCTAQIGEPCLKLGIGRAALISLLSLLTISAGVPVGPPTPYQPLDS